MPSLPADDRVTSASLFARAGRRLETRPFSVGSTTSDVGLMEPRAAKTLKKTANKRNTRVYGVPHAKLVEDDGKQSGFTCADDGTAAETSGSIGDGGAAAANIP